MGKRLTINYGDVVLYDGEPGKVTWSESSNGAVEVKAEPVKPNLLEQLGQLAAAKQPRVALDAVPQP